MTDLETIKEMLGRAKIKYEQTGTTREGLPDGTAITVWGGYSGFYTDLTFDGNGQLLEIGAWE